MHFDWDNFIYGATFFGIIAHAVNTFPTPGNVYGQWMLGIIKFVVGQRISAMNAIRGNDTVTVSVPQGTGAGIQQSSNMQVGPDSITISEKKKTVIPTSSNTDTGTGE